MIRERLDELVLAIKRADSSLNLDEYIDDYLEYRRSELKAMNHYELLRELISEYNYSYKKRFKSSELIGFKVRIGDVVYVDFGKAYINEAGFQHFAIVIGYFNSKALIVPMSSNQSMYAQSYCPKTFCNGKKHLFRLPQMDALKHKSVLFLNDIKYINTARIIDVRGNIDPNSSLFKEISHRIDQLRIV
ncbi:MAG: type II toxin-antitoxin system PemK/MazF family toxin [Erysipelothrix sp.]|nr:type II toxin-antitoxin system PemK/MazF family toxin [Erysipelothrix sp.]